MAKKSFSFRKVLPYFSRDNGASFWVSINDFECVPSCRRWQYPVIRLLINREAVRTSSLNSHPPRQNYKIVKTLIPLRNPLDRMAQTFFRWPQRLIKKMLHGLHYIFLWQTLFIPPSSFPSRYNRSQLTLISRKTFWGRTLWRESFILWTNNQTLYRVSILVVLAHKKSHQLREIVCFCCSFRCRVFMLPVARAY